MSPRKRTKTAETHVQTGSFLERVEPITETKQSASTAFASAVALHLDGKLKEALDKLNRAINAGSASPEIYSARGHILFELERYDEAAASYRKLLELKPSHPSGSFNLAVCLEKLGRWPEAAENFELAVQQDPDRTSALTGLGICLLHMEKPADALAAFDRCLSRTPDDSITLFGKAVALQLLDRDDDAIEIYEAILEKEPNSEESLVNLISIGIKDRKSVV